MITKEITYKKAFELKKDILQNKQKHREMMLAAAYKTNPKLYEIDNKLAELGANLALTALSGDTKKITTLKALSQDLQNEKSAILKKCEVPEIEYDCTVCNDTGYVGGRVCECVKKIANDIMLSEFTKEMPLDDCKFENFDLKYYSDKEDNRRMTAILKLCKEYVINFDPNSSPNLLFMGASGLGKTHLTLAIVSGVIEKGFNPIYGPCENLFSLIEKEKFTGENKGSYEAMINCDLLVLDDLGAEMSTAFSKAALYNLVNTRMLSKKPTIINTNLTMKEIATRYSERVASRLIGNYNSNKFLGNDIRQQKILGK
jgi:DNA replication protein DnaC